MLIRLEKELPTDAQDAMVKAYLTSKKEFASGKKIFNIPHYLGRVVNGVNSMFNEKNIYFSEHQVLESLRRLKDKGIVKVEPIENPGPCETKIMKDSYSLV
jgi:hypothetical protein